MENIPHIVKTSVYEGPLDLLLELIEKRKLLINDISLASVTDEYIARVNSLHELPMMETADFVALAATLLLIKSRSLLPTLTISGEESHDIKALEHRIEVYKVLKDAAQNLQTKIGITMLHKGQTSELKSLFIFDTSISTQSLRSAVQSLIDGFPKLAELLPKVVVKKIASLEDTIEKLAKRISSAFRLSFKEFSGSGIGQNYNVSAEAKQSIIISFLALLELVKQGIIKANQDEYFGDIILESDAVTTPSYE